MNNLYRRIVTMGMISFSAILAWVYCVLAYRDKTAYVVCLSLVLVISLYALANAVISLHLAKQDDLKKYISDTVNQTLSNLIPDSEAKQAEIDRAIEAERLAKATYVQLRKVNQNLTQLAEANSYNSVKSIDNYTALTLSLKEAVTESIANTAKIIIKYNKTDNQNIIEALNQLTTQMQDITSALDDISARIDSINIVAQPHVKTILEDSVLDDTLPDGIDVFSMTSETPKDTAPDISEEEEDAAVSSFFDEFEAKAEETPVAVDDNTSEPLVDSANSNQMLSQDDIEALFKAAMPAEESVAEVETTPEAVAEPEPVAETPVNDDPNRQLTPEEIAALFSANTSPEPVAEPEPIAETPVNDDPNRQLTPEEIAALFSANTSPEPVAEPEPIAEIPVNDDPNRQLTPEEIAALFSANTSPEPVNEPEPTNKASDEDKIIPFPVSEDSDPNKQLSADEIAALFASINGGN